jgi:hypothetical protein
MPRQGMESQCEENGKAWHVKARKACQGKEMHVMSRIGMACKGKACQCKAWHVKERHVNARQGLSRQGVSRKGKAC